MRRRSRTVAIVAGAAVVVAAAAVAAWGVGGRQPAATGATPRTSSTATVARRDLVTYVSADGEVGYGAATPVTCKATGTVTWLPAAGTVVRRGQQIARVDDRPVVLLYGTLPAYRELRKPVVGNDVRQFEQNLAALGYDGFTVDDTYSALTEAAVKRWQHDLGVPETGVVPADAVVVQPHEVRVARRLVRPGAASPADVVAVGGTTRVVTASFGENDADWAERGAPVTLLLPGGDTVGGEVVSANLGVSDSAPAVRVTVRVPDQDRLADAGTVVVRHVARRHRDVLAVPVDALLALAEGGYGVEVVTHGRGRVVAVRTGMFADGLVEVVGGGLRAGTTVRVPR
ncbi:MAG TPA: peptidoglycan-binding domain-containing protein [Actinocatenispora sp.]